jgi:polysaccharide biosynthesis transport protein
MSSQSESLVAASPVELVRIIAGGWRAVAVAVMAALLLAASYVYFIAERKYTATGAIMIEPPANLYPSTPGVAEAGSLDKSSITSQGEALRSRDLLLTVHKRLESEGFVSDAAAGGSPGSAGGVMIDDGTGSPESSIEQLQEALAIKVVDDSHVITAEFTDRNPKAAARALTLLFDEYIQRDVNRRGAANVAARQQYEARSVALKGELESLNRQIAEESARSGRYLAGGTTILASNMQAAVGQMIELQTQITDVNAKIKVISDAERGGSWAEAARMLQTPAMQRLLQNQMDLDLEIQAASASGVAERHPKMQVLQARRVDLQGMLRDEMRHALLVLGEDRKHLQEQARELQQKVAALRSGSDLELQGAVNVEQLEKSAAGLREMLSLVVGKLYDTAVAPAANAWIVEAPVVSMNPTSPRLGIILLGSTLLGLIGGALIPLWREGRRRADRVILQVGAQGLMPSLWNLPAPAHKLLGGRGKASFDQVHTEKWQETLRAIGHRLALKSRTGSGLAVAVVSAQPKEGKTMVALALSRRLAGDGYKVLLIDGDLRKPDIHRRAGTGVKVALPSLLNGGDKWRDLLQKDSSGLHLMAPSEPADLSTGFLREGGMRELLDAVRLHYDFVIVDSSPVLRVADGLFLLDYVDSAILVSGERTGPAETRQILERPGFPLEKVEGVVRLRSGGGPLSYPGY